MDHESGITFLTENMAYAFYLGLDAAPEEGTTLALVEKDVDEGAKNRGEVAYHLRDLQALGQADPDAVAERVQDLIAETPYVGRTLLVINKATGEEVLKALEERGLTTIGVTLTGGDAATQDGTGFTLTGGDDADVEDAGLYVSEEDLVVKLQELHSAHRFDTGPESLEEVDALMEGLRTYGLDEGARQAGAEPQRDARHSGHVLSTALACWYGEQHSLDPTEHLAGSPPPMGDAKDLADAPDPDSGASQAGSTT